MVYFNFGLQSATDTTKLKLQVNFRHYPNETGPITSVFFFSGYEDIHQDLNMVEKPWVERFPKKSIEYID